MTVHTVPPGESGRYRGNEQVGLESVVFRSGVQEAQPPRAVWRGGGLTSPHRPPCVSVTLQARYVQAKLSVHDRSLKVATVIESLEMEMELLCLTGVEDQLQADVRPTLETLRNAGIKVGLPERQPGQ